MSHPDSNIVPTAVGYSLQVLAIVGHPACWKHPQELIVFQPLHTRTERADIPYMVLFEGIGEDEEIADFHNEPEGQIGQYFNIRSYLVKQVRQNQALDPAKGMVGRHDNSARFRDSFELIAVKGKINTELSKCDLNKGSFIKSRELIPAVESVHFL